MSTDYYIMPVVGFRVRLEDWVHRVEAVTAEEPRFDKTTGLPAEPETVVKRRAFNYVFCGNRCLTDFGEITVEELEALIDGTQEEIVRDDDFSNLLYAVQDALREHGIGFEAADSSSYSKSPFVKAFITPPRPSATIHANFRTVTVYDGGVMPTLQELAHALETAEALGIPVDPIPYYDVTISVS